VCYAKRFFFTEGLDKHEADSTSCKIDMCTRSQIETSIQLVPSRIGWPAEVGARERTADDVSKMVDLLHLRESGLVLSIIISIKYAKI
jgi:hypothetical protein